MKKKLLTALATLALAATCVAAEDSQIVIGRIGAIVREDAVSGGADRVAALLAERHAAARSTPQDRERVLRLSELPDTPGRFMAVVYDPLTSDATRLELDGEANVISSTELGPYRMHGTGELEFSLDVVSKDPEIAAKISAGEWELYEAMPPVTITEEGRRLLNVGIASPEAGRDLSYNEIVGVDAITGEIVRYPENAPPMAIAITGTCGPVGSGCSGSSGAGTIITINWPTDDPIWTFDVRRPSSAYSPGNDDGRGLELTNIYYRGRYVMASANMPVLNVEYDSSCGPYRDWLYQEHCFRATGSDIVGGFRVVDTPSMTVCEDNNDSGTFRGVAIEDRGRELYLRSEMTAGWYRYLMEWYLNADGTIRPVFGFSTTRNSCVCIIRRHHGYWRFEFAPDGTPGSTTDGLSTVDYFYTEDTPTPITQEQQHTLTSGIPDLGKVRVTSVNDEITATFTRGATDRSAEGDIYARGDYWFLARNPNEGWDDPTFSSGALYTTIEVSKFLNEETLGTDKRSVMWYHGGFLEDYQGVPPGGIYCTRIGPAIKFEISAPPRKDTESGLIIQ